MRAAGYNAAPDAARDRPHPRVLLPAILLLKNGDACVLARRLDTPRGQSPICEIVMPGPEFHTCKATEAELESDTSASRWWPRRCRPRCTARRRGPDAARPGQPLAWARCAAFIPITAGPCSRRCSATC